MKYQIPISLAMLFNPKPFFGFGSSPGQESGSPNESHRVCTVRFSSLIFSQHLRFRLPFYIKLMVSEVDTILYGPYGIDCFTGLYETEHTIYNWAIYCGLFISNHMISHLVYRKFELTIL